MRILTRYVLREVCGIFLVTLASLTLLLMLFGVVKEAASHGLGLLHIMRLLPYLLPNALLFAVPGTILFAVSNVYGRMSGANEVVAIKSLGISPMVLLWPTILFSVILSFLTVWVNDIATSWGYSGVQRVVIDSIEDIIYSMLRMNKSYSTKAFSINVKRVDGRKLMQPTFSFQASGSNPAVTITAREAEIRSVPGSGMLTILFREGTVDIGTTTFDFPDTFEHEIPLDQAARKGNASQSPSHLALRVLPERIYQQRIDIERCEQELAMQAAYQMMAGDFDQLISTNWQAGLQRLQDNRNQLYRLQTEPPRRWANGFSCLCFVLIGAPMAMRLRNSDFLTSFFACFLPILIAYYPLLVFGVDRSKSGALPPYTVWAADAVVALWGVWLLRRVIRY